MMITTIRKDRASRPLVLLLTMLVVWLPCCVTQTSQTATRKPIYEDTEKLTDLPKKVEKKEWPKGTIVSVEQGKPAPFPGILLREDRAKAASDLRIAYDHLYRVADINRRLTLTITRTADKQLAGADAEILRLRKLNDSWWSRNKLWVWIVIGSVLTLGLGGFAVWGASELKK